MKIVNERPPIWSAACDMIGATPRNVLFCWGDTIFNPDNISVPEYLVVHEEVHKWQQLALLPPQERLDEQSAYDKAASLWWSRYIDDPWFRVQQEVEAYGTQYRFMCKRVKDRNARVRILMDIARSLSGPLYGRQVSHSKAMEMIKSYAKV
jgi:hypothetical protein